MSGTGNVVDTAAPGLLAAEELHGVMSPDGTTMLYVAWGSDDVGPEQQGVIAVPAVSAVQPETPIYGSLLTDEVGILERPSHRVVATR